MELFVGHLLESSLILGILATFYWLTLHKEPLFRFNRVYLLLSLALAAVVPFMHFRFSPIGLDTPGALHMPNMLDTVYIYAEGARDTIVPAIAKHSFFNWLYIFGAITLCTRMLGGIIKIGLMSKQARWYTFKGYKIADLPGHFMPFSFFNVMFINRSLYADDDLDKIIAHEMAHVRFKHSLDILFFEILLTVQWFNPFAWLIRHLLKELHEFQADKSVLSNGISIGQYKKLILLQATGAHLLPASYFNKSFTKKRFKMMTYNKLNFKSLLKPYVAFILTVGVVFAFSCESSTNLNNNEDNIDNRENLVENQQVLNDIMSNNTPANNELEKKAENVQKKTLSETEEVFTIVENQPSFPGGIKKFFQYVNENLKYPEEAKNLGIEGKAYVQFVVSKTGEIVEVITVKGPHELLNKEAERVIANSPKWIPGTQKGKEVNVRMVLPIAFKLD